VEEVHVYHSEVLLKLSTKSVRNCNIMGVKTYLLLQSYNSIILTVNFKLAAFAFDIMSLFAATAAVGYIRLTQIRIHTNLQSLIRQR